MVSSLAAPDRPETRSPLDRARWCFGSLDAPSFLPLFAVGDPAEQGHAVGFGPNADHAGFRECRILDGEQWLIVEDDVEAGTSELDAHRVPLIGGHGGLYAVAAFLADEVERAAHPIHGLVEHHI